MTDEFFFDGDSAQELQQRIDDFISRCEMIEARVFHKGKLEVRDFRLWLDNLMAQIEDKFWILHENPFYLVAEYNGADIRIIEDTRYAADYNNLARAMNWIQ